MFDRIEWRRKRAEKGLCCYCSAKRVTSLACRTCADKNIELSKARVQRLRSEGLCIDCGEPSSPSTQKCRQHADRDAEAMRAMGRKKRAEGTCEASGCHDPIDDIDGGERYCVEHTEVSQHRITKLITMRLDEAVLDKDWDDGEVVEAEARAEVAVDEMVGSGGLWDDVDDGEEEDAAEGHLPAD